MLERQRRQLLFAGMAFARVIVLNIGNQIASVAQPALRGSRDWAYSVQKWNARPGYFASVLLPISSRLPGHWLSSHVIILYRAF